jgi:hypothetical protein
VLRRRPSACGNQGRFFGDGYSISKTKPKLLVLYHRASPGCDQPGAACGDSGSEEQALREIREHYSGKVVAAQDLDIY